MAGLEKGDHFGEGALLHSGVRSASIRADGPLDVLVLGKESFGQITKSLDALRGVLERSHRSAQSAGQLLETAKDHPLLNLKKVAAVMAQPVATLAASLTLGAGYLLSGYASTLTQFALAQGLLIGVGSSVSFGPLIAHVSMWFAKRAMANRYLGKGAWKANLSESGS